MNRPRGRLALIIFLWIVPAGWSIGRAHLAGPAAEPSRSEADDDPGVIQGKTIENGSPRLKDRDPAKRKRAVEVIVRALRGSGHPCGREVAAADRVDFRLLGQGPRGPQGRRVLRGPLQGLRPSRRCWSALLEEHRRAVDPTHAGRSRLVDMPGPTGRGGGREHLLLEKISTRSRRNSLPPPEPMEAARSNARGLVALEGRDPGTHWNGEGLYAIRQDKGRPLVGLCRVTREELDKPITIVECIQEACNASCSGIDSKGLPAAREKYHAELADPGWWRAAYVLIGRRDPRGPRAAAVRQPQLHEGRVRIPPAARAGDDPCLQGDVRSVERSIEIKPDDRELLLGTFDVLPSRVAEQGRVPDHHPRPTGPGGRRSENSSSAASAIGRSEGWPARRPDVRDSSPDGKLLATAHAYNADPGDVKLWDMTTGAEVATLPVADRGIVSVAIPRRMGEDPGRPGLCGGPIPGHHGEIILWAVASRRELRRFGGRAGRISAPACTPDGRTVATIGADRAVRLWDVAKGARIAGSTGRDRAGRWASRRTVTAW